ncbi:MAG: HU family DNA-binding protein [Planctomycetota bacterium]
MAKRTAKKAKKKVARRPAAKKKVTKRTAKRTTKKAPAAKKPARISPAPKPRTKSEVLTLLAEHTGVSKKEVAAVFETMETIIGADLSKRGPGVFNVPGLMKVLVQRKPATKARKGINPFTGEPTVFKAKPARNVVKVRPLKGLKDLV